MKTNLRLFLFVGLLSLYRSSCVHAESYSYSDTNIKAAYILNLIDFVTFPNPVEQYRVCIIGDDLLGNDLASIQKEKNKRNIRIMKKEINSSLEECHFVYLSNSRPDDVRKLIYETENYPIVTLSDIARFASKEGMFEFVLVNGKIGLNINVKAAHKAGIKLNPSLGQIANQVLQ